MLTSQALKFHARMLMAPLIVALLGAAAAWSGHQVGDVADLLFRSSLMAVATILLSCFIFHPVARFAALSGAPAPINRIRRLPGLGGAVAFGLTALTAGSYVGHVNGSWSTLVDGAIRQLALPLAELLLFACYIGLFVYFVLLDYMIGLRAELWSTRGLSMPASGGRIWGRIILGMTAVASAPALILVADSPGDPRHPGVVSTVLHMDLAAAALLTVALAFVVARGVARPARMLAEGMERVDAGDFSARTPVVSDDELGVLSERFNHMVVVLGERERVRRTFTRFVPEAVADALIADEGAITPQERESSILYADIEGFTQLASSLEPRQILTVLNDHFDEVAQTLHSHGGVITQFQGDAVLAAFNLPVAVADHAIRAVAAARDICQRLEASTADPRIRMRFGIATGRVVGGTVGGGDRLGYTVHGDTVNRAARLEAMNKEFGTRILIDGFTADKLGAGTALRDRGSVPVRGLADSVRVYEPLPAASARQEPQTQ